MRRYEPACIPVCTFTLKKPGNKTELGTYIKLSDFKGHQNQEPKLLEAIANPDCGYLYYAKAADFAKIPGSPIAYWVSDRVLEIFDKCEPLGKVAEAKVGLMTSDNNHFLRFWWEVSQTNICYYASNSEEARESKKRWFPHNKGGQFRKWAGNQEYLVDWENDGQRIKEVVIQKYPYLKGNPNFVVHDDGYYFKPSVSWSEITSGSNAFRSYPKGFTFNVKGMSAFSSENCTQEQLLMYCNSKLGLTH